MISRIKRDLVGKNIGKLTVLDEYIKKNGKTCWLCQCDCGNKKYIYRDYLKKGAQSCGCVIKTHELTNSSLYSIWGNMKYRCNTSTCNAYDNYGGKGVKVCDDWNNNFLLFYNWAIANGYKEGLTIDRIDSDGNYEPDNCQWLTLSENVAKANKKQHRRANKGKYYGIAPNGKYEEFENATEFARNHNLNSGLIRQAANGYKYKNSDYQGWKFGFVSEKSDV